MRGDTVDSILRRFLATESRGLQFAKSDDDRIQELAEKNTEGDLDADERREYEAYVAAGELLALVQARARQLAKNGPSAG
jgi:hypothetical protein